MKPGLWPGWRHNVKYHPFETVALTYGRDPAGGQCQAGSLTGAVASQRVTEAFQGTLRPHSNRPLSAIAEGCLTARPTS